MEKGEFPILMSNDPKLCLCILPMGRKEQLLSPTETIIEATRLVRPLYGGYWAQEIRGKEIINFSKEPNSQFCHSYVRFFENGIIENVDSFLLLETGPKPNSCDTAILQREVLATAKVQVDFCFETCAICEATAFLSIVRGSIRFLSEFHKRHPFLNYTHTSPHGLHAEGHKFFPEKNNTTDELALSWFI